MCCLYMRGVSYIFLIYVVVCFWWVFDVLYELDNVWLCCYYFGYVVICMFWLLGGFCIGWCKLDGIGDESVL